MFPSVHSAYMHTPTLADTIATPLTSCTSTLQNSILISVGGVSLTAKQLRSSTHGFGVICLWMWTLVTLLKYQLLCQIWRPPHPRNASTWAHRSLLPNSKHIWPLAQRIFTRLGYFWCSMGSICHKVFYQRELLLKPVTRKVYEILREICPRFITVDVRMFMM